MAGRIQPNKNFLFTEDQSIKFLVDEAIFSDSLTSRTRAVNQIALHGDKALPAIKAVLDSIPASDERFKAFCLNMITKIQLSEIRAIENARFLDKKG